jgi:hypothetical protein
VVKAPVGWVVYLDRVQLGGVYGTKEAAFEAAMVAASFAVRDGEAVHRRSDLPPAYSRSKRGSTIWWMVSGKGTPPRCWPTMAPISARLESPEAACEAARCRAIRTVAKGMERISEAIAGRRTRPMRTPLQEVAGDF